MKLLVRLLGISVFAIAMSLLSACASNPHKAKDLETKLDKSTEFGSERIGLKDGNMVIQKKVEMNEQLRTLQNEVYALEDRVYGNRKYGSKGLYGALRACRVKQTSKDLGGDGKLMWTEPLERITDKEEAWEVGLDEEEKIVGVSEEFLKDRIERFQKYKQTLQKRQDEYEEKLEICDADVRAKEFEMKPKNSAPSTDDQG